MIVGVHHRGVFVDPTTTEFIDAEVLEVTDVLDGDSEYILRQFDPLVTDSQIVIARDRRPVHTRLIIVNTPEHKKATMKEWALARQDAITWINAHHDTLRARTYGYDDFGRLLTDLYDTVTQESLSHYLIKKGWAPYVPARPSSKGATT